MSMKIKLCEILFPHNNWSIFSLLNEGRVDQVAKGIKDPHAKEIFLKTFQMEPNLPPKYIDWVFRQIRYNPQIDITQLHRVLLKFDELANKKIVDERDINKYPDLQTVEDTVEMAHHGHEEKQAKKEVIKQSDIQAREQSGQAEKESTKVYEDSRWLIVQPHSELASCYYGQTYQSKPTRWCIAATKGNAENNDVDDDNEETGNYFNKYYSQGIRFVFIIDKTAQPKSPMSKAAIAYIGEAGEYTDDWIAESYEAYDAKDSQLSIEQLYTYYPKKILDLVNDYLTQTHGRTNPLIATSKEEEIAKIKELEPGKFVNILAKLEYLSTTSESRETREESNFRTRTMLGNATMPQLAGAMSNDDVRNKLLSYIVEHMFDKIKTPEQALEFIGHCEIQRYDIPALETVYELAVSNLTRQQKIDFLRTSNFINLYGGQHINQIKNIGSHEHITEFLSKGISREFEEQFVEEYGIPHIIEGFYRTIKDLLNHYGFSSKPVDYKSTQGQGFTNQVLESLDFYYRNLGETSWVDSRHFMELIEDIRVGRLYLISSTYAGTVPIIKQEQT